MYKYLNMALKIAIAATLFCVLNPMTSVMPSSVPLDPSFVIGINQAIGQKLQFGKDIIFTFGPYASVYTKAFHPNTYSLEILGSTYITFLYVIVLFLIAKHLNPIGLMGLLILVPCFTIQYDYLFYAYGLLVAIYCQYFILNTNYFSKKVVNLIILGILFSGFGLYPLIKGPLCALYFSILALTTFLFSKQGKWLEAFIVLFSTLTTTIFFWKLANQELSNLPAYFYFLGQLMADFSTSMSISGNGWEVFLYVTSCILCISCVLTGCKNYLNKYYLASVFFLYFFSTFKAGFIRHDAHALISANALMLATILIISLWPTKKCYPIFIYSLLTFIYIQNNHTPNLIISSLMRFKNTYVSTVENISLPSNTRAKEAAKFEIALASIKNSHPLPILNGSSDIYSFDQTFLIASGNNWSPRPIFQSYHAYNSNLADLNNNFLLSSNAPKNIFFKVETIDERLPAGDDGPSWATLIKKYLPIKTYGPYLILEKRIGENSSIDLTEIYSDKNSLLDWVIIPNSDKPLFAQIEIELSIIGKIKNIFYKPSPLGIGLKLSDGRIKQFRLIPKSAKNLFLVSPLIENSLEFSKLFKDINSLENMRVTQISVWVEGSPIDWQKTYNLKIQTLD